MFNFRHSSRPFLGPILLNFSGGCLWSHFFSPLLFSAPHNPSFVCVWPQVCETSVSHEPGIWTHVWWRRMDASKSSQIKLSWLKSEVKWSSINDELKLIGEWKNFPWIICYVWHLNYFLSHVRNPFIIVGKKYFQFILSEDILSRTTFNIKKECDFCYIPETGLIEGKITLKFKVEASWDWVKFRHNS